jgi:nicotinic acid mononucleotide adenylyltransferase
MRALEEKIPGLMEKVVFIDAPLQDLASREIRRRVARGDIWQYYVHPSVYDYIESKRLYRKQDRP